jgi:ubiquinone/menaquinone biosynthesis C-methylase UbiE
LTETPVTSAEQLARRRGDYGYDAPYVPIAFAAIGIVLLGLTAASIWLFNQPVLAVVCAIYAVYMLLSAGSYLYTTRVGKFRVWAELLTGLRLRGDEQAADLGCGRGAVLLMAAQLLPEGKITGIDLWKTMDQSGNDPAETQRNAAREGVDAQRIELLTADMRAIPLPDASCDLVLSSLAIHNIPSAAGRAQAIDEAVRLLMPGGRLLIADIRATTAYAEQLRQRGMANVQVRNLGWRFWYGSPFVAAKLVSAEKPV